MVDTNNFVRLGTSNMVLPPEGPKVYPFVLDFTVMNTQGADFITEIQADHVSFIQCILVDNSTNQNALNIDVDNIGFTYKIPALSQAYMPLVVTNGVLRFTTTVANNLFVPCVVGNFPVHPYIWKP